MGVASLSELRSKPAAEIQRIAIPPPSGTGANISRFWPIVDGYFLTAAPREVFRDGKENTHSLLAGSNANEGTTFIPPTLTEKQWKSQIETRYGARAEEYFKLYPAGSDSEAWEEATNAVRDLMARTALEVARFEKGQKTYIYYFDRRPPGHDSDHYGAFHSAELVYVFNNLDSVKRPWTETDRKLADTMSSYWVNFAKTRRSEPCRPSRLAGFGATPARGLELGIEVKPATMPPTSGSTPREGWFRSRCFDHSFNAVFSEKFPGELFSEY